MIFSHSEWFVICDFGSVDSIRITIGRNFSKSAPNKTCFSKPSTSIFIKWIGSLTNSSHTFFKLRASTNTLFDSNPADLCLSANFLTGVDKPVLGIFQNSINPSCSAIATRIFISRGLSACNLLKKSYDGSTFIPFKPSS